MRVSWNGKNKLVPSISLKLKNISDESVDSVQVNAIFRRVGEPEGWGEHFVSAIDRDGLPAHEATTGLSVLRSKLGYTGTESRAADAAEHAVRRRQGRNLRQARLTHLGRSSASITIDRQLLTQ